MTRGPAPNERTHASGEDVVKDEGQEAGRHEIGTKGSTQRPTGKSTPRNTTGVNPD